MSDRPYMKFWISEWVSATKHLTFSERGAYLALLTEAWDSPTCSLPADPAWLCRKLGVSPELFTSLVRPIIDEFWTEEDHRIFQKRQRKEFEDAIHRSEMAKNAINHRWRGRKVIPLKT